MITITDTITIAVITIAIITIAIITIAIIIIPGPNAHTYAHNLWEASSWFRWKIWVRDLLSPRSNCLPFLQNSRLQLWTPWSWGIVRFHLGGHANDKIRTMILNDVIILATICRPPSVTHHTPHAACRTLSTIRHRPDASRCLASVTQHVSGSSILEHGPKV